MGMNTISLREKGNSPIIKYISISGAGVDKNWY